MKHDWLNWLCTCFVIQWLWVQTFLRTKLTSLFYKRRNLVWVEKRTAPFGRAYEGSWVSQS